MKKFRLKPGPIYLKEYQKIFNKTKKIYPETRNLEIELKLKRDIFFTMRGAVKYSSLFSQKRRYYVYVNVNKKSLLSKLNEENIIGWYAHELAHIIEYEKMSNWSLFKFTFKYIFNYNFRTQVEKRVNAFAFNNGFAEEIFNTWKKFLQLEDVVNSKYKRYIINNYRPDWEQIKDTALNMKIDKDVYDSY